MLTTEQKYEWLCSKLKITDIDLWENDALINLPKTLYFQFWQFPQTVDEAVELAMGAEQLTKELRGKECVTSKN